MAGGLSPPSGSRGPLKDTGTELQSTVCLISNADEYHSRIVHVHSGHVVTLVTGHNVPGIGNVVRDLHADGAPIALQPVADAGAASIWSFVPIVQPPLEDGEYLISQGVANLVLDLAPGDANGTHALNVVPIRP